MAIKSIDELINEIGKKSKKANLTLIKDAYNFAREVHEGLKRASGESFIEHPLNVAYILTEMGLDSNSIAAALLHDVVEDGNVHLDKISKRFGKDVAMLVDGVTKLKEITSKDVRDSESIRKLMDATIKDFRVIIIKLADRLHNMRTIEHLPQERKELICKETLDIYAPLANKLGMFNIRWELEDLAFKYLEPKEYSRFKRKFGTRRGRLRRELDIRAIKRTLEKRFKEESIEANILGRPKHFYSIYRKMMEKKRAFDEIYDIIGLRVITTYVGNCYKVLGIIHSLWKPIHGEFDDYIAVPKQNMYQSLHTAVLYNKKPVEFQIRTEYMDRIAEDGIAAHLVYKGMESDRNFLRKLRWLRQLLLRGKENIDSKKYLEALKVDFLEDEIYVFTERGYVVTLPKGSTIIDFAYAINTRIGDRCKSCIVNGRVFPLRHELENGDIVSIITSRKSKPKEDWLKIVKTAKAKERIMGFLNRKKKVPYNLGDLIKVKNIDNAKIKIAGCCTPIPGNKIIAEESSDFYVVHKEGCSISKNKRKAEWTEVSDVPIKIIIYGTDRVGLFADVLGVIASTGTNVDPATARLMEVNKVKITVCFIAESLDHIKDIISRVKKIRSITNVYVEKR